MKNMCEGPVLKTLLMFAMPLVLGSLFQQLYNVTDTIIVGQVLGINSLQAMGATSPLYGLILSLTIGLVNGIAIPIAKYFGAKDYDNMRKAIANTFVYCTVIGIAMTIVALIINVPLLELLKTPDKLIGMSSSYLGIISSGLIIAVLYNVLGCVLRSVGDSKTPLYFLILSAFINIILDYILLKYTSLGVNGAAIATLIAQSVSVILATIVLFKKFKSIVPQKKDFVFEKEMSKEQITLGISMSLMASIVSIGTVVLQSSVNALGPLYIGAHTASRKIIEMLMTPLSSIGMAATTFASQNFGAKKYSRIKELVKKASLIGFVYTIVVIIITYTNADFFIKLFLKEYDAEVIAISSQYLKFSVLLFFALGPLFIIRNVLQGMGETLVPIISSILECLVKVAAVFILVPYLNYNGVILAEPLAWLIMFIVLTIDFRKKIEKYNN
ncbi:MAG: MATE family efflux transporter [Erysipelotrichaceae bacterium]